MDLKLLMWLPLGNEAGKYFLDILSLAKHYNDLEIELLMHLTFG